MIGGVANAFVVGEVSLRGVFGARCIISVSRIDFLAVFGGSWSIMVSIIVKDR